MKAIAVLALAAALAGAADPNYSPLRQINRTNAHRLEVAWKFDSGDEFRNSEMQCRPIVLDGVLYATTPKLRVIALDAATGKLIWSFDPHEGREVKSKFRNRGLMHWNGRIYAPAGTYMYALDAKTGKKIESFGKDGRVDLREGLDREPETLSVQVTSPGAVYKDLIILGFLTGEDLPAAPGHIRAYDAGTGKIRWTFRTIPQPGEFGYETWPKDAWLYTGGANSWPGLTLDEARALVFVPTGSAAFDFYGANRVGDNLFANCLLALRADTGERVWHFQFVRHDVWDRDLPAAPTLVRVRRNGRMVDGVAQITKSGHVFVFERETGKPLFPIRYVDVPPSDVEGEVLAKQQPLPEAPPPFARQQLTEDLLTRRTPQARAAVLERFRKLRSGPQFTPPSREGTIVFPGFDGAGEWGGAAFDPATGLLYVNSNEMAWVLRLVPRPPRTRETTSRMLYLRNCSGCHRPDFAGTPPEFPSLVGIGQRRSAEDVRTITRKGAGRMPGFPHLSEAAVDALTTYLRTGEDVRVKDAGAQVAPGMQYGIDGYNKFLDPEGYPAVAPPWGTLNAINLHTGKFAWTIPFGEFPELVEKGLRNTGSENYGGPVVTAGGVLFIGATNHDRKFRVFDSSTGKVLWETTMVAAGNATPVTYEVGGRQYVAIAAGGGKAGHSGGSYYAFALPASAVR